jgi:hypothetical protein
LVAAATGLTLAAIVCREAYPELPSDAGSAVVMAQAAKAGFAADLGARTERLAADLSQAPKAWAGGAQGRDLDCLSKAVYYEARGESAAGQAAVAQVVLNRAHDRAFPKSVCAVVFQPAADGGCQFSFACDGAMARPLEPSAWRRSRVVAARALRGYVMTTVGRALNFHVAAVRPDAAPGTPVARLGHHVFYVAAAHPVPGRSVITRADTAEEPPIVARSSVSREEARGVAVALGDLGRVPKPDAGPVVAGTGAETASE